MHPTPPLLRRLRAWHALWLIPMACVGLSLAPAGGPASPSPEIPRLTTPPPVAPPASILDSTTWIEMRNVDLRVAPNAVLRVRRLRGQVMRTTHASLFLDDTESFAIRITSGTVALSGEDLTVLLNTLVFNYPGSPLKKLKVRVDGSQIVQTGVMHKGVDLPFEMHATVSVTPQGLVRIRPSRIGMFGIDGGKLLRALGLQLDDMLDLRNARGAQVKGNDLYLDPTRIVPPPAITGTLARIRLERNMIVQDFTRLPDDTMFTRLVRPDSTVPNLVYFRGGEMRFGKLTMHDTDLLIVDADPKDPFDLFLARYTRQLIAGTSQTLEGLGLRVVMPDHPDL